jgi:circadian clock protein KaiB
MPRTKGKSARLSMRLYVAGQAPNSLRAIANARAICEEHFPRESVLEIVDLLKHPRRGLADGIVVTPTLLRLLPQPIRRMVGNLDDTGQVLLVLNSL